MSRLVSIGNHFNAAAPFADLFKSVKTIRSGDGFTLQKGDVVLFCGGEDISPSMYKQKANRYCGGGDSMSTRDNWEYILYQEAVKNNIPMLGICRGAQLMCALHGGSLYQHVTNHSGKNHSITTSDGIELEVCSVHHQMMNPFKVKHELLAWATTVISNVHLVEKEQNIEVEIEPEVVYFPEIKGLAIQYHPEFMSMHDEAVKYSRDLVSKLLIGA